MDQTVVRAADGVELHVGTHGEGPDVLVLSGGPGCVNYLEHEDLAPVGSRWWFPEPRGVGRSGGGPHAMGQAVSDLEDVRRAIGVDEWLVVGHSWGSDLAVRYALEFPASVSGVVGIAGHGLHKDHTWMQAYEQGQATEVGVDISWEPGVWQALSDSFIEWIHEPRLFRAIADTTVPMTFIAAGDDIRPSWPLQQLAELVPRGRFSTVNAVPHNFWSTHPAVWRSVISESCESSARITR